VRVQARPGVDAVHLYAHIDITELRAQQERLAQAERAARESAAALEHESALLQATLQNMEQGVAMFNAQGRVEYFNLRILELLELPRELLESRPLLDDVIRYQRERGEFEGQPPQALAHLAAPSLPAMPPLVVRQRPNGRILEIRSIPVAGGGLLRTYTDVTERHQHQQHIEHLASHDVLTGLYNRAKFMECLVAEVALARRQQGRLAVLYLDLDGFKPINDTHGHAAGDQVLVWVGQTLRRVARESDFVARLGGDEFAVLQRGIDHYDQAVVLAQRLADALGQPWTLGKLRGQVGASIGLALYPEHGGDAEALLAAADQAMYLVKTGRQAGGSLAGPRRARARRPRRA
ncbi:MAG: diguanylate cyclase domain-containing protein, partial [Nitrospirota bacterium]